MHAKPYDFRDLTPSAPCPAIDSPATLARIEAARETAFRDGYERAHGEVDAVDRATLAAISEGIAELRREFNNCLVAQCEDIRNAAGDFCRSFAANIAEAREVEAALSLLDVALDASAERAHLSLSLSATSARTWRERLIVAIKKRGAESFLSLESDADLAPGECRLTWRGGLASRLLDPAIKEIEALIARCAPIRDQSEV